MRQCEADGRAPGQVPSRLLSPRTAATLLLGQTLSTCSRAVPLLTQEVGHPPATFLHSSPSLRPGLHTVPWSERGALRTAWLWLWRQPVLCVSKLTGAHSSSGGPSCLGGLIMSINSTSCRVRWEGWSETSGGRRVCLLRVQCLVSPGPRRISPSSVF